MAQSAEGVFVLEDLHNLGPHYDRTLMAWLERFRAAWPTLSARYGETFVITSYSIHYTKLYDTAGSRPAG